MIKAPPGGIAHITAVEPFPALDDDNYDPMGGGNGYWCYGIFLDDGEIVEGYEYSVTIPADSGVGQALGGPLSWSYTAQGGDGANEVSLGLAQAINAGGMGLFTAESFGLANDDAGIFVYGFQLIHPDMWMPDVELSAEHMDGGEIHWRYMMMRLNPDGTLEDAVYLEPHSAFINISEEMPPNLMSPTFIHELELTAPSEPGHYRYWIAMIPPIDADDLSEEECDSFDDLKAVAESGTPSSANYGMEDLVVESGSISVEISELRSDTHLSSNKITVNTLIGGEYADVTSVALEDTAGEYGMKEAISGDSLIDPGTMLTKVGTGRYEITYGTLGGYDPTLDYIYAVKVTNGDQVVFIDGQEITGMTPSGVNTCMVKVDTVRLIGQRKIGVEVKFKIIERPQVLGEEGDRTVVLKDTEIGETNASGIAWVPLTRSAKAFGSIPDAGYKKKFIVPDADEADLCDIPELED